MTIAFVAVIALTLGLVTVLVLNRLDDYFTHQQEADLHVRSDTVGAYVRSLAEQRAAGRPVVGVTGLVDPAVVAELSDPSQQAIIADRLGQADVILYLGFTLGNGEG